MGKEYNIKISGSASKLYPTCLFLGLLYYADDEALDVPKRNPYKGEWGEILSNEVLLRDEHPMPQTLFLIYLSLIEKKFYGIDTPLEKSQLEELWEQVDENTKKQLYSHIVVGMAPYGQIAVWVRGFTKSKLIAQYKGKEVDVDMPDFVPGNPNISLNEYCLRYINSDALVAQNLKENGLPPLDLFDKYMRQYTYRYYPMFEKWNADDEKWEKFDEEKDVIPQFEYIEEMLTDGTHDKLHDGGLLKYHEAGKPKKLAMKWWIKKSEYVAYFWLDDEVLCPIFEKFYGAHRNTKVDFMLRIDAQKKKYELALFRQGLKEPQVLPEEAYQLLVFKSQFENYRSDNYNQERGAWIW